MRDAVKTKKQLIEELTALRQRCAALEAALSPSSACPQAMPADPVWYRHVVEHGLGLICMHDLDGVLLFINPAAAHLLGYEPHEMIGKKISLVLAPVMRHLFRGVSGADPFPANRQRSDARHHQTRPGTGLVLSQHPV